MKLIINGKDVNEIIVGYDFKNRPIKIDVSCI